MLGKDLRVFSEQYSVGGGGISRDNLRCFSGLDNLSWFSSVAAMTARARLLVVGEGVLAMGVGGSDAMKSAGRTASEWRPTNRWRPDVTRTLRVHPVSDLMRRGLSDEMQRRKTAEQTRSPDPGEPVQRPRHACPATLPLLFLAPAPSPLSPLPPAALARARRHPRGRRPHPPTWLHRRHSSTRSCSLGHRASARWRCSSCPRASPGATYGMASTALRTLRCRLCCKATSRPLARPSRHPRRPPSSPESWAPTALSGAASRPRRCSSAGRRCPSRRRVTHRCRRSAASARRAPWSTLASRSSRRAALQACMCT